MTKKSKYDSLNPQDRFLTTYDLRLTTVLLKLQSFCAYQERCIKEVKDKLKRLKVEPKHFNSIINSLKNDNYLNEERFVNSFVSDKFLLNKWGKVKIRYELLRKQISETLINKALSQIDDDTYIKVMKDTIEKKLKDFTKPLSAQNRNKLFRHMLSKGFEPSLIQNSLDSLL